MTRSLWIDRIDPSEGCRLLSSDCQRRENCNVIISKTHRKPTGENSALFSSSRGAALGLGACGRSVQGASWSQSPALLGCVEQSPSGHGSDGWQVLGPGRDGAARRCPSGSSLGLACGAAVEFGFASAWPGGGEQKPIPQSKCGGKQGREWEEGMGRSGGF